MAGGTGRCDDGERVCGCVEFVAPSVEPETAPGTVTQMLGDRINCGECKTRHYPNESCAPPAVRGAEPEPTPIRDNPAARRAAILARITRTDFAALSNEDLMGILAYLPTEVASQSSPRASAATPETVAMDDFGRILGPGEHATDEDDDDTDRIPRSPFCSCCPPLAEFATPGCSVCGRLARGILNPNEPARSPEREDGT
jgi:hypothetical protein